MTTLDTVTPVDEEELLAFLITEPMCVIFFHEQETKSFLVLNGYENEKGLVIFCASGFSPRIER
jgi:hypothetical protein